MINIFWYVFLKFKIELVTDRFTTWYRQEKGIKSRCAYFAFSNIDTLKS